MKASARPLKARLAPIALASATHPAGNGVEYSATPAEEVVFCTGSSMGRKPGAVNFIFVKAFGAGLPSNSTTFIERVAELFWFASARKAE